MNKWRRTVSSQGREPEELRMRKRLYVALASITGQGTPFTALMSPHSWSSCTPHMSQA